MSDKLHSEQVLETVRERFSDPLKWEPGGWGSGDRRCVVGTIRQMTGSYISSQTSLADKLVHIEPSGRREPWFTAYEEVIFACVSIIQPDWDAVKCYKDVRSSHQKGWAGEQRAILEVLTKAESQLIDYNDSDCRSADEMLALMEEAVQLVRQQREARESEWTQGKDEKLVEKTLEANPDLKEENIVLASAAESRAAEAEYEAMRKENPELPPVWPGFFTQTSMGSRKAARKRVRARGRASVEKGIGDRQDRYLIAKGYAIR